MKKILIVIIVLIAAGLILAFGAGRPEKISTPPSPPPAVSPPKDQTIQPKTQEPAPPPPQLKDSPAPLQPKTVTVKITASGHEPQNVTIKKGDSVKWVNETSTPSWPASVFHPTHGVYPATGGCIGSTFDACKGLGQGEAFTFKFDFVGTWKYHDHLNPSKFGSVVVTE